MKTKVRHHVDLTLDDYGFTHLIRFLESLANRVITPLTEADARIWLLDLLPIAKNVCPDIAERIILKYPELDRAIPPNACRMSSGIETVTSGQSGDLLYETVRK